MGTFGIYALVLTGLYLLYLTVVITMDIFGKKAKKKDDIEEFSASDGGFGEESSALISETEDGYSVHHGFEPDNTVDSSSDAEAPSQSSNEGFDDSDDKEEDFAFRDDTFVSDPAADEALLEQESQESLAYFDALKSAQDRMSSVIPSYQDECSSDEFAVLMVQPLSQQSRIFRSIVGS